MCTWHALAGSVCTCVGMGFGGSQEHAYQEFEMLLYERCLQFLCHWRSTKHQDRDVAENGHAHTFYETDFSVCVKFELAIYCERS